ncbi:acyloxyacyl hydrolase [Verrucomicrobia bacterium S94]|nr:acyloxyacyl hydrolase [Verrucomicrobia bacterium S94]
MRVDAGGGLYFGVGAGPQGGTLTEPDQYNAVVDLGYMFYSKEWTRVEFDLGAGVTWLGSNEHKDAVYAFSIIPALRLYFWNTASFRTYVMAAAGPTYLTESYLGNMELGGYFAFNDFVGVGVRFGEEEKWNATLGWRHISNAGLFRPNRGFDVPVYFLLGKKL